MCQYKTRSGNQCTRQGQHNLNGQTYCLRHYNMLQKSDKDKDNIIVSQESPIKQEKHVRFNTQQNKKDVKCNYWRTNGERCKEKRVYKGLCKKHFNKIQLLKHNIKIKEKKEKKDKVKELPVSDNMKEKKKEKENEKEEEEPQTNPILNELLNRIKENRNNPNYFNQYPNNTQSVKSRGSLFG